jgi:hypothetical protein
MAITLSTAARNAACNAVVDAIDGGSPGKLVLKSAGDVVLCTITLNNPAFGAAATGVAALDTSGGLSGTGEAAAGGGTAATKFDFTTSADATIFSGTVGVGSGEIQMDNNSVAEAQVVNVTGYNHTQPA